MPQSKRKLANARNAARGGRSKSKVGELVNGDGYIVVPFDGLTEETKEILSDESFVNTTFEWVKGYVKRHAVHVYMSHMSYMLTPFCRYEDIVFQTSKKPRMFGDRLRRQALLSEFINKGLEDPEWEYTLKQKQAVGKM